jgi:hypothetical protein
MKQFKLNYLFIAFALITVLASCHKDKVTPLGTGTAPVTREGLYVLNQGEFGDNNSTLTFYNYSTKALTADIFGSANAGSKLGDTGNDIEIYGSKMYIVVNNSNVVDVVNAKTGKLLKQITLNQPRDVVFYKGNAFITSYDGYVGVVDTTALTLGQHITVGRNPEQMVIVGTKMYVANSGGLSFGNPDKTVSVIDLTALAVTKTITVIADPVSLAADTYGHVYVLSLGDFDTILPGMTIINDATDVVLSQPTVNLGYNIPIVASGSYVYYITADNKVAVFNAQTQTPAQANFITDGTAITTPFALAVDPLSGEVFVTDAKDYASNGALFAFDKTGKLEYSIATGISPGKIAFLNN